MSTVVDNLAAGARVAVIRLRSLGDCVLTTPALHILKTARPDLRIGVVVEDRFSGVFEGNPDIETILSPSLFEVARWRAQLCLNLHGGTRSMKLTLASGAAYRAGFAHHSGSAIYNVRIPRAQEILAIDRPVHTAEHLASAMFCLGVARTAVPRARLFADPSPPTRPPYAVIHPVAATLEKTWGADGFIQVARYLRQQLELDPIFVGGSDDDLSAFTDFRILSGKPLREVKALISGASLFIGNDSGPAHIAAAFGIPTVVLFGPSDPVAWCPWQVESEVLIGRDSIQQIDVQQVIHATESLRVAR